MSVLLQQEKRTFEVRFLFSNKLFFDEFYFIPVGYAYGIVV